MSRDPAVASTREPYAYVNDNPLNGTDPTGLAMWGAGGNASYEYGDLVQGAGATASFDRWGKPSPSYSGSEGSGIAISGTAGDTDGDTVTTGWSAAANSGDAPGAACTSPAQGH